MDALTSARFWVGVIIGVIAVMGWQRYQAGKTA